MLTSELLQSSAADLTDQRAEGQSALCIDLDGTLVATDLLLECLISAVRRAPWVLLMLPLWLVRGRHIAKAELAARSDIDVSVLPYSEPVLALIREAKAAGQHTLLVTGTHQSIAERVADHLGIFDEVLATNKQRNLTGHNKARALSERFGIEPFRYAGNGSVDLPVWEKAASIVTVNAPKHVVEKAVAMGKPHTDVPARRTTVRTWLKAIRIHQWTKNALLFVPLLTGHELGNVAAVSATLVAFVAFGLCASATYIINDLFDLNSDRQHRTKKNRPFAAGTLSVHSGVLACAGMLAAGALLSLALPMNFKLALASYMAITLAYSFWLKRVASLDVLTLASLYTLRVIAGAFAAGVALSFWLLAFSMFMFLCLALVKRVSELLELQRQAGLASSPAQIRGREYDTRDIPILQIMGATSGYLSVLVLALYINSPEVHHLYARPQLLWLIAPGLLLWVTRLWVITTRGYMDEDPIAFAIKDPETWVTAAATCVILYSAT